MVLRIHTFNTQQKTSDTDITIWNRYYVATSRSMIGNNRASNKAALRWPVPARYASLEANSIKVERDL